MSAARGHAGAAIVPRPARSSFAHPSRAPALLVPALLLAGSLVFAGKSRVLILAPSAPDPVVARVRDELAVLGFEVQVAVDSDATADLEQAARRSGAAAVARVGARPRRVQLWVDPGASGASTDADPLTQVLRDPPDPGLLALRAVELLRARLLPVPAEPAAPASAPPPPPPPAPDLSSRPTAAPRDASPPAPAAAGPFALLAGPAVLVSPGGVPAALHVRLGAEWDPIPRVGVEALAFVPATAGAVTAPEGSVSLRVLGFGGGVRGLLTDPRADLSLAVGLGLQALRLSYRGEAAAPWAPVDGAAWAASPYVAASAAYRLHRRLAVRLDLMVSLVRPEPVVRIAGQDAASFGQPAVLPSLDLEVRP